MLQPLFSLALVNGVCFGNLGKLPWNIRLLSTAMHSSIQTLYSLFKRHWMFRRTIVWRKSFTKKGLSIERLPPTQAALHQYILTTSLSGSHIWGQLLELSPTLLSPDDLGSMRLDTGLFYPLWTSIPQASLALLEQVMCGSLQGCTTKQCKCIKAVLNTQPFVPVAIAVAIKIM